MSALIDFLLDILKFSISGLIVFYVGWSLVKPMLERSTNSKLIELKKATNATTLPLRLQAHERMVLFIERINPANLLLRAHVSGISAAEMQQLLISEIRTEYQHNITQQIYISIPAWGIIARLKEDTITLINNTAKGLPSEATSVDLNRVILNHLAGIEDNPYEAAANFIKADLQQLF